MQIITLILVAVVGSLLLMTGAAVVSDPTIVIRFGHILWNLFGYEGFFWYILTLPVLCMLVLLVIWVILMHIIYAPNHLRKKL